VSDALVVYNEQAKVELSKYVDVKKIHVAYNSLDTDALSATRDKISVEGKENLKRRINFNKKYNLTFIGRITKEKSPELLIDIYEKISPKLNHQVCIHFIGEGSYLETIKNERLGGKTNVDICFHGALYDEERIGEILYCSDLMIIPGALGLSINHALNYDCPVVSFKNLGNGPFHSPEAEYIEKYNTGFLVEEKNLEAISDVIYKYLIDPSLQTEIRKNIQYVIQNICSIDNMAAGFEKAINSCKNR
jgi:glycosyltransferase involved in cell wall biosynthesis